MTARTLRDRPVGPSETRGTAQDWEVGIVVPARDEESTVVACVTSIRRALAVTGCRGTIVVVADRCQDRTAALADTALGGRGSVLECDLGLAGAARRLGSDWLLARARKEPAALWLASTDADSYVPPHWLESQLALARSGAAAVAGVVRLDVRCDPRLIRRFRSAYLVHPDGTHPHVHGANLGVRGDAYLDAGGWPAMATGEDSALWRCVQESGWPTISSAEVWVTTSARYVGRAPDGFASDLSALEPA